MQRWTLEEFETSIREEGKNKADVLKTELEFLAPISLNDPVESDVKKAVRIMVTACLSNVPMDAIACICIVSDDTFQTLVAGGQRDGSSKALHGDR